MCSDERSDRDSTVYNRPASDQRSEETKAMDAESFMRRAFEKNMEDHPNIQNLRQFFPNIYEKIKKEFPR